MEKDNIERDIIIIGGGPGGYVAAIRGAQLGAKVTLIEKENFGGTCLNWGCIPTKALYKSAQVIEELKNLEEFGISLGSYELNLKQVQERKANIVKQLVKGIEQLVKANGIEVIKGKGSLMDSNTVRVITEDSEQVIKGQKIIIATGSKASKPTIPGSHLSRVITSDELLSMDKVPNRLVIIGGGVIGIEFAGILRAFGSEVRVIEFMPTILPLADAELAKRLALSLKKKGIQIHTDSRVLGMEEAEGSLKVNVEDKKSSFSIEADLVLMATGRAINIEDLNLEAVGVKYDSTGIEVNENFETNIPGIYAIGDVIGGYMLAHVASEEGKVAVEKILGHDANVNYKAVPNCIFTFPELSGVGITEEEAKSKKINYKVGKFQFGANGKALTMGKGEGIVKVIADQETEEILGVHILGPHASDLIHEGNLAIAQELKVTDIIKTIHAHPTLAESFLEAVAGVKDEAIHILPKGRPNKL